MKKILLSLFGIITIGLVNFSDALDLNFSVNCRNLSECKSQVLFVPVSKNSVITCSGNVSSIPNGFQGPFTEALILDVAYNNGDCSLYPGALDFFDLPFNYYDDGEWNYGDGYINSVSVNLSKIFGNGETAILEITHELDFNGTVYGSGQLILGYNCSVSNIPVFDTCNLGSQNSCDYSGYILESDVNSQYCMLNNLCPSSECPEGSGYSNVFVSRNNSYYSITGTNNIYVNLPSYLGYNYDYSNEGDDLDINIAVSQDTGYIEGVLNVQNYKPSSEDFTKLVGMLAPYTKYLVFLLFVFIIWAWIKKSFKSKKL